MFNDRGFTHHISVNPQVTHPSSRILIHETLFTHPATGDMPPPPHPPNAAYGFGCVGSFGGGWGWGVVVWASRSGVEVRQFGVVVFLVWGRGCFGLAPPGCVWLRRLTLLPTTLFPLVASFHLPHVVRSGT